MKRIYAEPCATFHRISQLNNYVFLLCKIRFLKKDNAFRLESDSSRKACLFNSTHILIYHFHMKMVLHHMKTPCFHMKMVRYHMKMLCFHMKMVLCHMKMLCFHMKKVLCHMKTLCFHMKIVLHHIVLLCFDS